jgi:hypothetical protein
VPAAAPVRGAGAGAVPGDLLLRPVSVVSLVVLVVNDHWLKARLGTDRRFGAVTGKLSDVAGLVFFPLVLASLLELGRWLGVARDRDPRRGRGRTREQRRGRSEGRERGQGSGRPWVVTRGELAGATVVTGVGFAAVQVVPVAAGAYAGGLAALRWLPAGLAAALTAAPSPPFPRIHHVMDVTDCLCLPALWWGYGTGLRGRRSTARKGPT